MTECEECGDLHNGDHLHFTRDERWVCSVCYYGYPRSYSIYSRDYENEEDEDDEDDEDDEEDFDSYGDDEEDLDEE